MATPDAPAEGLRTPDEARRRWHLKALIACNIGAALLLASWFYEPTRSLWDALDRSVFAALNGTLRGPRWWQVAVAAANNRKFDLVPFFLTVIILWFFGIERGRVRFVRRAAAALMIMLYILAVREIAQFDIFDVPRDSPTRVFDFAIRISEQVTWFRVKDGSSHSFPGDHSLFLMMLNAFFWYFGGRRFGLPYVLFVVIFSLPRMIAGAHWLTDNVVGGGFILLVSMSWLLGTPLKGWLLRWFEPVARKLLWWLVPRDLRG